MYPSSSLIRRSALSAAVFRERSPASFFSFSVESSLCSLLIRSFPFCSSPCERDGRSRCCLISISTFASFSSSLDRSRPGFSSWDLEVVNLVCYANV